MIKVEKRTEEIIIKHRHCDLCDDEIKCSLACGVARCEMCKKDLCNKCVGHEEYTSEDYREVYCKKCWDIGESFRKEIEKHKISIGKLNDEWLRLCQI